MKHIASFLIAIVITMFLSNCTEIIDFDLNEGENNRLVVDGSITNETKAHQVILSRTASYYYNQQTPRETGAQVSITDGVNTYTLNETEAGVYETQPDVTGEEGKTYTLNIKLTDGEVYTASSTMRKSLAVDSLGYEYQYDMWSDEYFYLVYIFAQENPGKGDCYMWDLYKDGIHETDTVKERMFVDDQMYDGKYISYADIFWFSSDQITNDTTHIMIKTQVINKDYYDFLNALMLETYWRGSPFDGPPANIPSNVSNGALGFFNAITVNTAEIDILFEQNMYNYGDN